MSFPRTLVACLSAVLLAAPLAAQGGEPPLGAALGPLLAYAREHNPQLAASRFEREAAQEAVKPAGALPDPSFQLELMDFTNAEYNAGREADAPRRSTSLLPGEVGTSRYRLVQPIPFWGKRGLRREVASAQAEQGRASEQAALVEVEAVIKSAFARHYQATGQARILRETLALVTALERIVLTRYGVGLVPQQDAIQIQSEMTSLKVELLEAGRLRRNAVAGLNAALSRPADAPLAEPEALPPVPAGLGLATLRDRLEGRSPELARERAGITAAEKERLLARRNRLPDFALGLTDNRPRDGVETLDLMVEVEIPLQQGARIAQVRQAERMLDAARAKTEAAQARIEGRLGESWAAFESAREKAGMLRATLLPQAEAGYRAAQAGYEAGRVNFNTLIEAERQKLRARLTLLEADVEMRLRVAELEQLVGAAL